MGTCTAPITSFNGTHLLWCPDLWRWFPCGGLLCVPLALRCQAQLRSQFVLDLQRTNKRSVMKKPRTTQSLKRRAMNSLVADYLKLSSYDCSLSVFLPESQASHNLFKRDDVLEVWLLVLALLVGYWLVTALPNLVVHVRCCSAGSAMPGHTALGTLVVCPPSPAPRHLTPPWLRVYDAYACGMCVLAASVVQEHDSVARAAAGPAGDAQQGVQVRGIVRHPDRHPSRRQRGAGREAPGCAGPVLPQVARRSRRRRERRHGREIREVPT